MTDCVCSLKVLTLFASGDLICLVAIMCKAMRSASGGICGFASAVPWSSALHPIKAVSCVHRGTALPESALRNHSRQLLFFCARKCSLSRFCVYPRGVSKLVSPATRGRTGVFFACSNGDPKDQKKENFVQRWLNRSAARSETLGARLRAYGISAVISYGIFDFITYTISFILALKGYVAAGKAVTRKTLPQLIAIMWGINNFSRPFRIAGALALAPIIDERGTL